MSRKIFYFPASERERHERLEELYTKNDHIDALTADCFLGLAAQDRCSTRDELVAYAWENNLVPYLRFFLERRGWLDDDWDKRIDHLSREFRREVN